MKETILKLALVFLIATTTSVFAADEEQSCDEATLKIVANYLKLKNFYLYDSEKNPGVVVSQACKQSPLEKNITIVSFAYQWTDNAKQTVTGEGKKVIVALVDTAKQQVVANYQTSIEEDALTEFGERSFYIDTARYQLGTNTRAIGLRFHSAARGASCPEGRSGNQLTLFIRKKQKLTPVLTGLPMYQQQSLQGSICTASPEGVWEDANLSIGIKKTHKNGYADLLVTANIETSGNVEVSYPKPRIEKYILRYDGKNYMVDKKTHPWWIGFFSDGF